MSRIFTAFIKENRNIRSSYYLLTIHPLKRINKPLPGQFFMVSIGDGLDPLLRRPFSLYRLLDGDIQILYRVVGKGTKILSEKKAGDVIDIIGPLGRGFSVKGLRQDSIILVAGGLGIAPIFALTEVIKDKKPVLFYGARTKDDLLSLSKLKEMGIKIIVSTDDGSYGYKGTVTDHLRGFLSHHTSHITHYRLYACGPRAMLKEVSDLVKEHKLSGFISLEENMACGVGTCLGCVVNTRDGYKCVCKEGPVFPVEDIIW